MAVKLDMRKACDKLEGKVIQSAITNLACGEMDKLDCRMYYNHKLLCNSKLGFQKNLLGQKEGIRQCDPNSPHTITICA